VWEARNKISERILAKLFSSELDLSKFEQVGQFFPVAPPPSQHLLRTIPDDFNQKLSELLINFYKLAALLLSKLSRISLGIPGGGAGRKKHEMRPPRFDANQ
jgi:hypothetical protein